MILVVLVGNLAISAVFSLLAGWALMLAVGVIHHEWIPACPTIGYWWAALLALLLRVAFQPIPDGGGDS
jgi:hypothetical protein